MWNSETVNSTSLAPIGSFFNLLQEDEDQNYANEKFYTTAPGKNFVIINLIGINYAA